MQSTEIGKGTRQVVEVDLQTLKKLISEEVQRAFSMGLEQIDQSVQRAHDAGAAQREAQTKDAFKDTEKRLYAYPLLKQKIKKDERYIAQISAEGLPERSNSIMRYSRPGSRISPEEAVEAEIREYTAAIARNRNEVETIESALETVQEDSYYDALEDKYFKSRRDEAIALDMHCDPATVRRNRNRLVKQIAVLLYGTDAM